MMRHGWNGQASKRVGKRGRGYSRLRYCCLESLDKELFIKFQQKGKLEKLELINLTSMRVSYRIIPFPDSITSGLTILRLASTIDRLNHTCRVLPWPHITSKQQCQLKLRLQSIEICNLRLRN